MPKIRFDNAKMMIRVDVIWEPLNERAKEFPRILVVA